MTGALALLLTILGGDPAASADVRPAHWAYRRPEPPALPAESFERWARNPIDLFIGERLAREGFAPAPEAGRAECLRRASLDLTGLPPTLEELDAFLADPDPAAYEHALARLLASPHYGEHQASRWLDLARYADSRGYEKDERREMWRYRDWVIEAFQRDLPFDRFTLEQLAGDLLPGATLEQQIATGFHRNTLVNEEGGTDPEEFRVAAVKDRVNTTALVWLGTTLECAQCHDHKYDPFPQEEYYRFYAFFDGTEDTGNSDAPTLAAPTRAFEERARGLAVERAELEARLGPEACAAERETWRAAWARDEDGWHRLRPDRFEAREGSRLALLEDDSVLAFGPPPSADDYLIEAPIGPGTFAALRLEVLLDESLPEKGPGRPEHRNFVLSRLGLTLDGEPLAVRTLRADYHQIDYAPAGALDDDPQTGWASAGGEGEAHSLLIELEEPLVLARARRIGFVLEQRYGGAHLIGRVRFAWSAAPPPELEPVPPPRIAALLAADSPSAEDAAELARWYARRAPALAPVRERLAAIERELVPPQALVMRERAEGHTTHVHERGNFLAPGIEVTPGVPAVLAPLQSNARLTRIDLARWLCDEANPLTARVTVNRVWQRIFGTGLVATDNDFGLRGEAPSHPELLDWLALEFRARGWSHRELLRTILTSATYRQSSRVTPALQAADPENRLLARGPKLRLEAENLRDVALAASGLLSTKVGGPSVFPPQPEGIWQSPYSSDRWPESAGEDRHRRGLYTFLKRSAPYPTFLLFDATSRELACSRRTRSNTPLQALALLNDPVFVACAQALARRMLDLTAGAASADERLRHGFRLCTAREPNEAELGVLLRLLAGTARLQPGSSLSPPSSASKAGEEARLEPGGPGGDELAAWSAVATVLLNLDETITKS